MMRLLRALPVALAALFLSVGTAVAAPVAAIAAAITTSLPFISAAVDTIVFYGIQTAIYAGLGYISNKLLGPKLPAQAAQERQASVLQLALGEVSREVLFGEAATGGSLLGAFNYGGEYGTDWVVKVIAVADHRCEALVGFYVNDQYVLFQGDGPVDGYNGQLEVYWRDGRAGQTFPLSLLNSWRFSPLHTQDAPITNAPYVGMAYVVVAYKADKPDAQTPVWSGHPALLWRVHGKRLYDPRKDSSVGGSGPHRWSDPDTWEWGRNAAVCRYNWLRGIYALDQVDDPTMLWVGRGLSIEEAPPERLFAYANLCDELVDDGAGGTEPRYLVDGVIRGTDSFLDVEEMFSAATAGQILQPEGGVEVEPGAAKTPVFEITDDDLLTGQKVEFSSFLSDSDRVNTVLPRYIEPDQMWQDHAAPVQRDEADVIADGGPREETVSMSLVTRATQAQRVGRIRRNKARLERRAKLVVGPRFAEAEEGDWITWTSARHTQGQPVTFVITAQSQDQSWATGWTLEEIDFDAFGFGGAPIPHSGGYTPATPPDALALSGVHAQAIQIEGSTGALIPAVRMSWDQPVDAGVVRIRAEVRRFGSTDAAPTTTEAVNDGVMIVTNGVSPDSSLEARLVPLGAPGRPIVPSSWLPISTGQLLVSGVATIGGRTPDQIVADLRGVAEVGRQLTQTALQLSLQAINDRADLLKEVFHNGERLKRIVIDDETSWEAGDKSFWERLSLMAQLSSDGQTMIMQQDTLMWSPTQSMAQKLSAIITQIGSDIATATSQIQTWVNSSSAGAQWINALEVAFGGNFKGAITQQASVISGMGATWTLVADVNGHIAGMRLVNTGTLSSLVFDADEIGFTNGSDTVYPLAIVGGVVKATNFEVDRVKANSIVTNMLVGGAVTSMDSSSSTPGATLSIGVETTLHTRTVHSDGGQHVLLFTCDLGGASGAWGFQAKIYRDGALVRTKAHYMPGSFAESAVFWFYDTPGAGNHVYTVTGQMTPLSNSGGQCSTVDMLSIELKA